jgi:uncharacterized membrane protein YbhN (UPF0104 family)
VAGAAAADRASLAAAAAAFAAAAAASALAWATAVRACGSDARRRDVVARYFCGSLVNSVAPPPAGEATRIALVGRLLQRPGGTLTATGVCGVVALVRALIVASVFALLVGSAAAALAPVALAVAIAALAGARRSRRVRHVADAAIALRRSPRLAVELVVGVGLSTAARVVAAGSCCAALGIPHALAAGAVIVPALELAALVPLAPANLGVTSAAVAFALHRDHVAVTAAVSAGIVIHVVESIVGIGGGLVGALGIAQPTLRRRAVAVLALACVAAAAVGIFWIDPT